MQNIFLELVRLSLIGSLFAVAVMVVRIVFQKAPKWLFCVLWGIVALRLICPVSIESSFSLVPERIASGQIISNMGSEYIGETEIIYENNEEYLSAVEAGRQPVYSSIGYYVVTEKDSLEAPRTVGETVYPVLSWVWLAGMVLLLAYAAVSYLTLSSKMAEATRLKDNIWQCEQADSPFVLGIIKPRIYMPYAITGGDMDNVLAHERAHILRKDHWWKPIGFLLLSVHWFNPVLWLAYVLLCRDIEAACDEKVIRHMDKDEMRAYSTALLHCSIHRRRIAACPLAFGEVGVKERIKRVMNYKKPAFWIIVTVLLVCVAVAVCFMTIPAASVEFEMSGSNISDMDTEEILFRIHKAERLKNGNVYMNENNFSLTVDADFNWAHSQAIGYFFYKNQKTHSAQLRIFPEENRYFITESTEWVDQDQIFLLRHYLDAIKYLPQDAVRDMAPADRYMISHVEDGIPGDFDKVISYSSQGIGETDGWLIHLRIEPLHAAGEAFKGTGDENIHLFYWDADNNSFLPKKLLSLVNEIVDNPNCAASSNPFDYIAARQNRYNEILTYGETAVAFFLEQLRTGENGLREYIMAVACADITGIGDKNAGADWATAQEWLALYDKSDKSTVVPPVIATDYVSGKQARLMNFGYTSDMPGQSVIACGIAPWQGEYTDSNTLVLDGKNGQNQILLAPDGFSVSHYKIYLPDGTVYDNGTRMPTDTLSLRVMGSDKGVCLIAPFQTGAYIYELGLVWPEQGLAATYGLKIVMTGEESDYDRAVRSVFAAYGEGNPQIAVSLVDRYILANAVYSSARYLFKVENIPNAPIWVEVEQRTGEIIGEVEDHEKWLVNPPYVEGQTHVSGASPEKRQMTLSDVIALSKLGMELTWEDLKAYSGTDIGSGLYVVQYDIDPEFYLLVGDGKTTGKPMYAALNSRSSGAGCDIRENDVSAFIAEKKNEALDYAIFKAIISRNADGTYPDVPGGLLPTESHWLFAVDTKSGNPITDPQSHMEETTVYLQYVYTRYYHSGGTLEYRAETATAAAITFGVEQGGYTVKEFWEPSPGKNYNADVRNTFPTEAAEQILDPMTDGWFTKVLRDRNYSKAVAYLAGITGLSDISGTPVAWLDDQSSTSGDYFRFAFDVPYTKIVASCNQGSLVDLDSGTVHKIDTSLTFGAGNALYWIPSVNNGQFHENTQISFTLYDGETAVFSGTVDIAGCKYREDTVAYIATLNLDGFDLRINNQSVGAVAVLIPE